MVTRLVSIITPLYNGENYIAEAIQSVLSQNYPHFELLVINDGSTDHSHDVISPFLGDKRIRYFEKENGGVASARNFALQRARGTWIGFLDQDDRWLPDKLTNQITALQRQPDAALIHSRQAYIDAGGNPINDYSKDWVDSLQGHCFSSLFNRNRIAVLTVLLNKEVLISIGAFNEKTSMVDDYELWLRICYRYPIAFLDEVVAEYRLHDKNASYDHFRMERAELKALSSLLNNSPGVISQLNKRQINRRFAALHTEIAKGFLWQKQDHLLARTHFIQALKHQPLNLSNLRQLLWCSINKNLRNQLSWYVQKLRPTKIDTPKNSTRL